ncbi:MAG: host attachment protein [Sedimentitalea sp.]|nr:host attachment protein [Sedimentitalea sp.]
MAKLEKGAWVVVADTEKAQIYRNAETPWKPRLESVAQLEAVPASATFGRPGRRSDGGPNQMSALEAPDLHKQTRERFARELAELLYKKAHKGEFAHLVIVAAPQFLGALRDEMHQTVLSRVIGEIPKTLTERKPHELAPLVKTGLEAQ